MDLKPEQLERAKTAFRLSPRELDVLRLLFAGCATDLEVAERCGTTRAGAQAGVRMLLAKTGTRSRHEMVLKVVDFLQSQT